MYFTIIFKKHQKRNAHFSETPPFPGVISSSLLCCDSGSFRGICLLNCTLNVHSCVCPLPGRGCLEGRDSLLCSLDYPCAVPGMGTGSQEMLIGWKIYRHCIVDGISPHPNPKIHMLKPHPQCDCLWTWGL